MNQPEHKPNTKRVQSRCRVDCTCGWRGEIVSTFGEGYRPWVAHFKAHSPCPLCDGSGAQCEACLNRRFRAADELTTLWDDEHYLPRTCRRGDFGTCQHPECGITDDELAALSQRAHSDGNAASDSRALRPGHLSDQEPST